MLYLLGLVFGIGVALMVGWSLGYKQGMRKHEQIVDIALSAHYDEKARALVQGRVSAEIERVQQQGRWRNQST